MEKIPPIRLSDSRLRAIRMNCPPAGRLVTFGTHDGGAGSPVV